MDDSKGLANNINLREHLQMNKSANVIDINSQKREFQETPSAPVSEIYPGFSLRLNQLIDLTDLEMPAMADGRQSHVANLFESSRHAPGDWLKKDKPPKPGTLRKIVTFLLLHIEGSYNALRVEAWLKYGEGAVGNPFEDPHTRFQPLTPLATIIVTSVAKELKIPAPSFNLEKCLELTIETLTDFQLTDQRDVLPAHRKIVAGHIRSTLTKKR